MTARPPQSPRLAALAAALALAACGKSAKELPGCSTRAQCAATEVCQSGFCQADRAAPAVAGHLPITDATNVWWGDPIAVTFDEPIDPASVTDASLLVTGPGGGALTRTWSIAGNTLSVRLPQAPADPGAVRLTVTLSGQLRDPAGNFLQGAPVSWGFELPIWQEPAPAFTQGIGAGMTLSHAVAPDGSISLAWQDTYASVTAPEVRRAAGGTWTNLGRPPARVGSAHGIGSSLAIDATGRLFVAYLERASLGPPSQVIVATHDGTAWAPLGGSLNADPTRDATGVVLRLDSAGQPVVLWAEPVGSARHLFAKRWNGASWDALGGEVPTDAARSATGWSLAAGPAGALSLAFADGSAVELQRYGGSSWSPAAANLVTTSAGVDLVFDGSGVEVASYGDGGGSQVARWRPGSQGVQARLVPLGAALSASGFVPSLAWRPSGRPGQQLVAGTDGSLFGWSGSEWTVAASLQVGTLSANAAGVLACVGQTTVGFEQHRVTAVRFNR
jgi:hypothetical protein